MTKDEAKEKAAAMAREGVSDRKIARHLEDMGYSVAASTVNLWVKKAGIERSGKGKPVAAHVRKRMRELRSIGHSPVQIARMVQEEFGINVSSDTARNHTRGVEVQHIDRSEAFEMVYRLRDEGLSYEKISKRMTQAGYPIAEFSVWRWLNDPKAKSGKNLPLSDDIKARIAELATQGLAPKPIRERIHQEFGRRVSIASVHTYRNTLPKQFNKWERQGRKTLIFSADPRRFIKSVCGDLVVTKTPVPLSDGRFGYKILCKRNGGATLRLSGDVELLQRLEEIIGKYDLISEKRAA